MAGIDPLYDRFGGMDAVARLVFAFYDRVLKSPTLAPYFGNVDLRRLIEHQTKFLASLMGGPPSYTDAHLREVHQRLGIDDEAFDAMVAALADALASFGLSDADRGTVIGAIAARRRLIVAERIDA